MVFLKHAKITQYVNCRELIYSRFIWVLVYFQSHPAVIEAGKKALDTHGAGLSSVRFICGTMVSPVILAQWIKISEILSWVRNSYLTHVILPRL